MEVQDGFIVGIYNYCDRWCTRCTLNSHCRLFADQARFEAELDPGFKALIEAPPAPDEASPALPPWLSELIEKAEDPRELAGQDVAPPTPRVPEAHRPLLAATGSYRTRVDRWLIETAVPPAGPAADARDVIAWFHYLIATKVHRAFTTWSDDEPEDSAGPSDRDGSVKIALIGIERSSAAWLELMKAGVVEPVRGASFIAELMWMSETLEAACPRARSFVRPAFDEPEALMRFLASEGAAQ